MSEHTEKATSKETVTIPNDGLPVTDGEKEAELQNQKASANASKTQTGDKPTAKPLADPETIDEKEEKPLKDLPESVETTFSSNSGGNEPLPDPEVIEEEEDKPIGQLTVNEEDIEE